MRIGIITDIHEDVARLAKALAAADREKCDHLACLGDIVGFDARFYSHDGRSAAECVRLVRENFKWVTAGNHDLFAARRFPSYSDGFVYPEEWFDMPAGNRKKISGGKVWCFENDLPSDLGEKEYEYLAGLPEYIIPEVSEKRLLLSHYIYPDFTGSTTMYVRKARDFNNLQDFMSREDINLTFSGHSHNAFPGFVYPGSRAPVKGLFNIESDRFKTGDDRIAVFLPPLAGETMAGSFAVFDTSEGLLIIKRIQGS